MTLITPAYKAELEELHRSDATWGDGHDWFTMWAFRMLATARPKTILDYGCGKGLLKLSIPAIKLYDPCMPGFSAEPEPADLLLSCCSLEHVEPECLDDVLAHMRSLTKNYAMIAVSYCKSGITLPSGRNAHLIIEELDWWLPRLMTQFSVTRVQKLGDQRFIFIGRPKNAA